MTTMDTRGTGIDRTNDAARTAAALSEAGARGAGGTRTSPAARRPRRALGGLAAALIAARGMTAMAPAAGADPAPVPEAAEATAVPMGADQGSHPDDRMPREGEPGRCHPAPGDCGDGLNVYRPCYGYSFSGTEATSCDFTAKVANIVKEQEPSAGDLHPTVQSPVTRDWYTLTCTGVKDSEDRDVWKCVGGNDAVVYPYPASIEAY
ncbi:hypothetical protein [Corynebacterium sp. 335C]